VYVCAALLSRCDAHILTPAHLASICPSSLVCFSCSTPRPHVMSGLPPTRPFLVCDCGFEADFLLALRRHQYGIHDGLIGHHTQLPRRRPREAASDDCPSDGEDGLDAGSRAGAAIRSRAGRAFRGRLAAGMGAGPRSGDFVDGNEADDESDAPPSPPPSPPPSSNASSASASTAHSAVESQLRTLLELTRILVPPTAGGAAAADAVPEYTYSSVGLHVRALYEALGDARRAQPLVDRHKRPKLGRLNTVRLRALQRFVLQVSGAGLSTKDQEFLYEFLEVWDGTKAGMAEDAGHHKTLRYHFPSVAAFKQALRDDLDDAALNAGWKKVRLVEGGIPYEAYFRDVLQVLRALIKRKRSCIQLWSGVAGPAPPSDRRETPMDGEAFKLCEELVMKNREELACVLGLHVFSDSSQLSWSGGTLFLLLWI